MNTSNNTTVVGASLGASLGLIVAWIIETLTSMPVPDAIQGAIVVVCTALVALVYPAEPRG